MKKENIIIGIAVSIFVIVFVILTFVINFECPFHYLFHLLCPFCGGRTMILDLLHLRIIDAFMDNQLLFIMIPALFLFLFIKYILNKDIKIPKWIYILLIIITIAFTIVRNIV